LKEKIEAVEKEFQCELSLAKNTQDLESLRVRFLGKKGPVTALMKDLKDVPPEEKPLAGKWINACRDAIEEHLQATLLKVKKEELNLQLEKERLDISLPGSESFLGRAHPLTQMIDEMLGILKGMGFSVYMAPEIESDYYNYGGLNYPEDHPARDMQDTYYLDAKTLLRSHTTNFQQRVMESFAPPLRMCSPGKCYRNETISARSHVLFHQIDVMYIDKEVSFADLLATLEEFYSKVFREKIEIRVRSSYFPFVEPGVEVDVRCTLCHGKGCGLCKQSGWLEVCGAGMIHPEVLKAGGIDPETTSGFAWGGGIERVYLLRHGVNDIRLFLENDMRFLEQFP
jgi:phenylalanyl-tRNA synthetase alpha chain